MAADPGRIVAIGANDKVRVTAVGDRKTVAETDAYAIELTSPATMQGPGGSVATVDIRPKKGWHLNREFPTKLTITAPSGVTLGKAEQVLADATSWAEDGGQFAVRFTTATAGTKEFAARLKFAVCTESTCDPKREDLAWAVEVVGE